MALTEISPHQFEWWAVVARPSWPWARFTGETPVPRARPAKDHKKGADSGIDGYINFFDDTSGKAKKVVVQVKSG